MNTFKTLTGIALLALVTTGLQAGKPSREGSSRNKAPMVRLDTAATIKVAETGALDGSRSFDRDGFITSYSWSSSQVAIANPTSPITSFVAPENAGAISVQLTVTDNLGTSESSSVTIDVIGSAVAVVEETVILDPVTETTAVTTDPVITDPVVVEPEPVVVNQAPVAVTNVSLAVTSGNLAELQGDQSYDTDGSIVSYAWTVVSSDVQLAINQANQANASLIAPEVTTETTASIELTVTDDAGASASSLLLLALSPVPYVAPVTDTTLSASAPTYTPSVDSRIIYVSSTEGDDTTGAFITGDSVDNPFDPNVAIKPYKTIAAASSQARTGYPDWVLLKRGDVWTSEKLVHKSGRSIDEPFVIGVYGATGDRPQLRGGNALDTNGGVLSHFVLYGVEIYNHLRDPKSPEYDPSNKGWKGIRIVGGGENITLDNIKVSFHNFGIQVQSWGDGQVIRNFTMKNSIISDSYGNTIDDMSSGMLIVLTDGITIENNVFDHNGWNKDVAGAAATKFNHNIYIQRDNVGNNVVFKNNIVTRGASHGVHGRPGGLYENNLFIQNAVSLGLAYKGTPLAADTTAYAFDNVILEGRAQEANAKSSSALWGIDVASDALDNGGAVVVDNNIVVNAVGDEHNVAIWTPSGGDYTNNIAYNWRSVRDVLDMSAEASWSNPDVSVGDYMASLGEGQTTEDFINKVKNRPLGADYSQYAASVVNDFIRAGFGK